MKMVTNGGRESVVGVTLFCLVLQCFLLNFGGVESRHVSLRRLVHRPRGERITENAVTIEAIPPPETSSPLLRAGYATHLKNNLKKAFALQLLHQAKQNNHHKNSNSDEFISLLKNNVDKIKKVRLEKKKRFRGGNVPFLSSSYGDDESESVEENDDVDDYLSSSSSFDQALEEEDPHFYQERYKTIPEQNKGQMNNNNNDENTEEVQDDKMLSSKPGYSLANSYFDNEYSLSQLQSMECVTPTKSKGYCSTFRTCVPSLFNSEGELEAPALAELVSMSIGYCSASVHSNDEISNQLLKRVSRFTAVANRIICCPGTPPPPGTSAEDSSAEKFNDFLGGSESHLEPDEDDVDQGLSSSSPKGDKKKGSGGGGNASSSGGDIFVDLKGELVQQNPDTEAEVWHSEEDIKAAMNKKPANIIPIEALIPEDKLPLYDPHTNTFSKQILEKVVAGVGGEKDKEEVDKNQIVQIPEVENGETTPKDQEDLMQTNSDEFISDQQNNEQFLGTTTMFSVPHDDGILPGGGETSTQQSTDFEHFTTTTSTEDESTTTTVVNHGENNNSTFIKISPEPVVGANGKFTLEKGVHIQQAASHPTPRPPPNPAHQVHIAQTTVNVIKAGGGVGGENVVVDSNQVFLTRPAVAVEENRPVETNNNDYEQQHSSQSIEIVHLADPRPTSSILEHHEIADNSQFADSVETTTDIYNRYHHVQGNSDQGQDDDNGGATTGYGITTSTQSYTNDIRTTDSITTTTTPVYIPLSDGIQQDDDDNHEIEHNHEKLQETFLDDNKVDNSFPTTLFPEGVNADLGQNSVGTSQNDGGKDVVGFDDPNTPNEVVPQTTTAFSAQDEDVGSSGGESSTATYRVTYVTSSGSNDGVGGVGESEILQPESMIHQDDNHIVLPKVDDNNNSAAGNGNDNGIDTAPPTTATTPQQEGNPIQLLFPTDAATLSPQNDDNSVENGASEQNVGILSDNQKDEQVIPPSPSLTPSFSGEVNTPNSSGVGGGAVGVAGGVGGVEEGGIQQPSKESEEDNGGGDVDSNQSISSESSSDEDDNSKTDKAPIPSEPGIRQPTTQQKVPVSTPPTPEPEIGGIGDYQILSACATQDYYRSLEEDTLQQYPYLATIVGGSRPFCSGSLITDRHILTASHFLSNITVADVFHMRVHVGYKTAFGGQTEGPFAVRKVLKVIRHKGFSFDKLLNDVAILLLDRPIRFSENIHPVCLSNNPQLYSNGITEAFETGWVEDPVMKKISPHHPFVDPHVLKYFSFGYNNVTWTLQQSTARVKTNEDCQSNYEFLEKSGIFITDSMVCAATEDGKSCSFKGNSGAPLFTMQDGKPIQLGLVSWGIGCGHFPAVFTGVSKYLPWIEKVVQKTR